MRKFSGELLKRARESKGSKYTQARLALDLSNHFGNGRIIPVQSVSDWERNNYAPSAESLAALAEVLGCKIDYFFAVEVQSINESPKSKKGASKGRKAA